MAGSKERPAGSDMEPKQSDGSPKRYVAFLRGINVGGRKVVKMEGINRIFTAAGFTAVKTLIQSGNVLFNSDLDTIGSLKETVEKSLFESLGFEVEVFLLCFEDIIELYNSNPFGARDRNVSTKFYFSLLSGIPHKPLKLPLFSDKLDLELFRIDGQKAYILSHEINGRFGFPNNFLEDVTGLTATTRNWNTIEKLIKEKNINH